MCVCAVQYYLSMMHTVPWRCLVNSENRATDSQSDLRIYKVMVKPSIHYNNHIYRLHSVGKLNLQSMLLCIAIHGSKVPLCLSMVLPYSPVAASVLLPSLFLISPSLLMFLFTFVVGKVIEAPRDMTLNEVNFILCHRVVFYRLT